MPALSLYRAIFLIVIVLLCRFAAGTVSVPTGVLSFNNVNAVNDLAQSWGGEDGVVYFGQTFTNLHTLEMFSFYITPDPTDNTRNKIYTSETFKSHIHMDNIICRKAFDFISVVMEWSSSNFAPTALTWKGSATLGTQAGYSTNNFTANILHEYTLTFQKVTANIGSALTLTPSKTYMLAFYFLASVASDVYALASVSSGSGQAFSMQTNIPPTTASWEHWTNEGTFLYEIVIGDCNAAPCQNGGTCVGPDVCSCPASFSGATCSIPVCSATCKNSGTCIAPNTCSCAAGWQGTDCSMPVCNVTCSNGGTCTKPNTCTCSSGWGGVTTGCTTPICVNACIHGSCTGPNTCNCANNWQGTFCNTTGCDDLTTCGGHGVCTEVGSCNCTAGFDNSTNCASCAAGYLSFPSCYSADLLPSVPVVLHSVGGLFNVTVLWEPADSSSNINYTLEWNFNGAWEDRRYQGPLIDDFSLQSLAPNTTYLFRISAFNEYGLSEYDYFSESTLSAGPPSAPVDLLCNEYSRSTMDITWNSPSTDGGLPILGYHVRMSNLSSEFFWNTADTECQVEYLLPATSYLFSIAAFNQIGASEYSTPTTFQTAFIMCGDGICDTNENCSTCFFDCGACGYQKCPGTQVCGGRGTCTKGLCNCLGSWYGDSCQYEDVLPITAAHSATSPSLSLKYQNAIQNSSVSFGMFFTTIQEIDQLYIISRYNLEAQPTTVSTIQNQNSTTFEYQIELPNQANITVSSEKIDAAWYSAPTSVEFANESIQVPVNGLKFVLRVDNWPFLGLTHRLVLSMRTNVSAQGSRAVANPCAAPASAKTPVNGYSTDVDSDNLRSVSVTLNGVTLYGKFMENAYFDSVYNVRSVQFQYDSSSDSIDVEIPHFWNYVELDPNFQVLLDPYSDSSDSCTTQGTGKAVGGVFGAVAGVAIIGAACYYYYAKSKRRDSMAKLRFTGMLTVYEIYFVITLVAEGSL